MRSIGKQQKGFKQRGIMTIFFFEITWLQCAWGKSEFKDTTQEATVMVQVMDTDGVNQGGGSRDGETWADLRDSSQSTRHDGWWWK